MGIFSSYQYIEYEIMFYFFLPFIKKIICLSKIVCSSSFSKSIVF